MKKVTGIIGLVLAAVFIYLAVNIQVPDKFISSWGTNKMTEYVGGDAYNFIIEASLRGGEIAGAQICKAIYFACAAILGVLSLAFLSSDPAYPQPIDHKKEIERVEEKLTDTNHSIQKVETKLEELLQPAEKSEQNKAE